LSVPTAALVLPGGGAHAAYQVGVLAQISERVPELQFPILTGNSAGAINVAYLAAHRGPWRAAVEALRREWGRLTVERVYRVRPAGLAGAGLRWLAKTIGGHGGPAVVRGLMDMEPLRQFLAAGLDLGGIDANISTGRLRAAAVSATSYASGETVTFVHGADSVPTWRRALRYSLKTRLTLDHVLASAAIPILFPAIRIGDQFFADGSVRQMAPLAPAIHLGARAILMITMRGDADSMPPSGRRAPEYPSLAEVVGLLLHTVFLDAPEADAERLERINQLLESLPPGSVAPDGLRPVRLLLLRPSRDLGALALAQPVRLPPLVRWVVRGMGGQRAAAAGFLSYLLFDPVYTTALIELGYADARSEWSRIERFLSACE
jgi:NTE family protein